jgi:predicted transcriptional regulator
MATLTIRMPDDKCERLRRLARQRHISLNKLIEELTTAALTQHDLEAHFLARAAQGSVEDGLRVLDELDARDAGRAAQ